MRSFTVTVSALWVVAVATLVRATAPDSLALAVVKQQFINAHIVPDGPPSFDPSALLVVDFTSTVGVISVGQPIARDNTSHQPVINVETSNTFELGAFVSSSTKYTILMVDLNYVGSSNPNGYNVHWLSNDVEINLLEIGSNGTLTSSGNATILPTPDPTLLLEVVLIGTLSCCTLNQLRSWPFDPQTQHWCPTVQVGYLLIFFSLSRSRPLTLNLFFFFFSLTRYVSEAGLSSPIAGSYFTVEVGTATVTPLSTSPVDTKTLTSTLPGTKPVSSASTTSTKSKGAAHKSTAVSFVGAISGFLFAVFMMM
ncbi:uncharacterized protein EI90DRAFT_3118403 [Cantharellus anzutake]|uniref:uncharacterized protein n=1 Tax=Cantharellus anzutake TaxID=1750568 RepID=UPI001904B418|nr:uncharacterized protein EI90DRAFT_3118403 [Cantharellus anzutake]KAF8337950.1 hypothetical protein EI90DRAFT_3118403 [Cantharellus anzutake]